MLAYVFWHRPKPEVKAAEYEVAQHEFHSSLKAPSACFRLAELPFGDGTGGYEDWYLVKDWAALGELNARAVRGALRGAHDRAASAAEAGWGAIYELVRGDASIPAGTEWLDKPRGEPADKFVASITGAVWRRQLVLGPASEFCRSTAPSPSRTHI